MIKVITYDREDTCPICRHQRSIEAYTVKGNPIRLSLAIDRNADISKYSILYLRCSNCKREFFPKWITKYPSPAVDRNLTDFMNGYKQSYTIGQKPS